VDKRSSSLVNGVEWPLWPKGLLPIRELHWFRLSFPDVHQNQSEWETADIEEECAKMVYVHLLLSVT